MFVITADQIDSRHSPDMVGDTVAHLDTRFGESLALPADRNAGDELQALATDATAAIAIVLDLTRSGTWSVGLGTGDVELPLAKATREGRGPAFIMAREAVTAAKKSPLRFALRAATNRTDLSASDVEAMILLLLAVRDRRTDQGWQVYDLLEAGHTQRAAASALGITPQAVSDRMSVAQVRIDLEAQAPLARVLAGLDEASGDASTPTPTRESKGSTTR